MRKQLHLVALALLVLAAPAFTATRAGTQTPSDSTGVDRTVQAEMQRQHVPGVAVAIVRAGRVVLARGYGLANVEHDVSVTPVTIFQSGSLGKQFTAVAVMMQVEAGRLALDDSITRYLPDAPASWQPITIRHLLTHTSGIADYAGETAGGGIIDMRRDYTEDELVRAAYHSALQFPPGSRWRYSNTGYLLLGAIVRRTSGQFYGDVLAARVFKPLGMRTARVISEADIVPHRAAGYRLVDGQLRNQEWVAPSLNTTADGALYFSVEDLIAWDRGLRAGALLKPESWEQINTPVRLTSGATYPYGFGWEVDTWRGRPWLHHGGSWQGFKTYISRYLAADLTVIVLTNLGDADPGRFVDRIVAVVEPDAPLMQPSAPITDSDPATTAHARAFLDELAAGRLTDADRAALGEGRAGDAIGQGKELARLGPLRTLTLVDRRRLGDEVASTWLARYGGRVMRLTLEVDAAGNVRDYGLGPEPTG